MAAPSAEVSWLCRMILSTLEITAQESDARKLLLCGEWDNVEPVLSHLRTLQVPELFLPHLIIAAKNVDLFVDNYGVGLLNLVHWDEQEYEEELKRRVLTSRPYRIPLAVDYHPTIRRLYRVRDIISQAGIHIIPHENAHWRARYPEFMRSLSANRMFLKMDEVLGRRHVIPPILLEEDSRPNVPNPGRNDRGRN